MLKPLIILGLSLAFVGCSTNSGTTASSGSNVKAEKVAKKDDGKEKKVICKRQARVGSHFKKTQCWTAEEYARKQKEAQEDVRRYQNNNSPVKAPSNTR